MGVVVKNLGRLIALKKAGLIGPQSAMLEFGAQNLHGVPEEVIKQFVDEFCPAAASSSDSELSQIMDGSTMASLMKLCELEYLAIDIFSAEGTMLFDLNTTAVPENLRGCFDIVTNFGTTEHILNQFNCFICMHDFTRVGGIMYHDLPLGGHFYHGYFSYTPLLFHHLAKANGYQILFMNFSKKPESEAYGESSAEMTAHGWPDSGYHPAGIEFVLRKTRDEPFRIPVEVGTSIDVDVEFLNTTRSDIAILDGVRATKAS